MEECIDHGESRDWWHRCSDRAERGGRQETVRFGSVRGLLDPKERARLRFLYCNGVSTVQNKDSKLPVFCFLVRCHTI